MNPIANLNPSAKMNSFIKSGFALSVALFVAVVVPRNLASDVTALNPFSPWSDETVTVSLPSVAPAPAATFARLPLSFVRNDGQADPATKFELRGRGYWLSLDQTELVMMLGERKAEGFGVRQLSAAFPSPATTQFHALRMKLVGAHSNAVITGEEELPGKFNYFIGNDPARWRTNVPTFAKVRYREVYSGIDLVYYGNEGQLEYDFVVEPGADPDQIALTIEGADAVEVDDNGDLRLAVGDQELHWRKPKIYQELDGIRVPVDGEYVLGPGASDSDGASIYQVAFRVAPYDRMLALVIDPVLVYSTYLGGGIADTAYGIAVDAAGSAYVTGQTFSRSSYNGTPAPGNPFPTTTNATKRTFNVIGAAYVTKFSAHGSQVLYSTVLCGSTPSFQSSGAYAIQVDAQGQAVIAGTTDATDFPVKNALQPRYGGGFSDAFVAKLNADRSALVFSTFLGGNQEESQGIRQGLGLDAESNIYVAGQTRSANFPITNAVQTLPGGDWDWFVTKMDAAGTRLVYSTFLGGPEIESGPGFAVVPSGHAYIAGNIGVESPRVRIAEFDLTGSVLEYSTTVPDLYLNGIAADTKGALWLSGFSTSETLPVTSNAFQPSLAGGADAFIARLNPAGSAVELLTYLGGSEYDVANAVAVDRNGNAFVVGRTPSPDFPVQNPVQAENMNPAPDGGDAFVVRLSADGKELLWATYLGGSTPYWNYDGVDEALAVTLDSVGAVYVAGRTTTSDFPVENAFQPTLDTSHGIADAFQDAFVAKFTEPQPPSVQITHSDSTLAISWPTSASGFGLESTDSLAPAPNWQPEPTAPEIVGDQNVVTLEIGPGSRFFRLQKP